MNTISAWQSQPNVNDVGHSTLHSSVKFKNEIQEIASKQLLSDMNQTENTDSKKIRSNLKTPSNQP